MNKALVTIALAGLCLAQAANAVTVTWTSGYLQDSFGIPMSSGRLLMVASNNDNDFGRLTLGNLPAAGFTDPLETDDLILANWEIGFIAGDGTDQNSFSFNLASNGGPAGLVGGEQMLFVWFPGLGSSATEPGNGQAFGSFRDSTFVVPALNGEDISLSMFTPAAATDFGVTPNATELQGRASLSTQAIPEPSTITLIALGLLGLFSSRRNRK